MRIGNIRQAELQMREANSTAVQPRLAALISLCTALSGCAVNPLVSWEPPKRLAAPEIGTSDYTAATTQDYAILYTDTAQKAYKAKLDEQVMTSAWLGNGLIVAGGLAAALAAGRANADTIIATSLVGGTAYALGSWNIDKRRFIIYQAGAEAFNCAKRALAPLKVTLPEFDRLAVDVREIGKALDATRTAIADAKKKVDDFGNVSAASFKLAEPMQLQLGAANEIAKQAEATLARGQELKKRLGASSDRLIGAVDKIDSEAGKALLGTLPDLSSVSKVIAALPAFAGSIAPGAGVESSLTKSLAAFKNSSVPSGPGAQAAFRAVKVPDAVSEALSLLRKSLDDLAQKTQSLAGDVAANDIGSNADNLSDCGLGDVAFPLSVVTTQTELQRGGSSQFVVIKGGTPPFEVRSSSGEVVTTGPVKLERTFQVAANATAPAETSVTVLVTDSSNPIETVSISLTTSGTAKPAKASADATAGAAVSENTKLPAAEKSPVKDALDHTAPFSAPDKTLISIGGGTVIGTDQSIGVTLSCKVKPSTCIPRETLRKSFLDAVGAAVSPADLAKVRITTRPADCQCPQ